MQAMSLAAEDDAVEHNDMKGFMQQLESTSQIVVALSQQLQVCSCVVKSLVQRLWKVLKGGGIGVSVSWCMGWGQLPRDVEGVPF